MTALTTTPASNPHEPALLSKTLPPDNSLPSTGRVRLHITPFNPQLLSKILPPDLQSEATAISFHHTQVSPEKGFGYVELPTMAAEKLKKKLNGSILKGEKVKVQNAKPEKHRKTIESPAIGADDPLDQPSGSQRKKRKITDNVQDGVELPQDRTVKRGWTETPAEKKGKRERTEEEKQARKEKKEQKKKREGSKYTTEPELLFKAKLEPTAVTTEALKVKDKSGDRKAKKEKRPKKATNEMTVHEFENTRKHASFLKENQVTNDTSMTAEYVEGKGWVAAGGSIVEAAKPTKVSKARKANVDLVPSIETASVADKTLAEVGPDSGIAMPEQPTATTDKPPVHPLEALFKRPKTTEQGMSPSSTSPKKPPPIDTSKAAFSFFDEDAAMDDNDEAGTVNGTNGRPNSDLPPMTPKTKQDFHMRGLRSAAPEPDTATHERRFDFSEALDRIQEDEEDEVEEDAMDIDANGDTGNVEEQPKQESEFRKWFYEHRGENNRAWRQKRREAMKVKRQRENKRLARKILV